MLKKFVKSTPGYLWTNADFQIIRKGIPVRNLKTFQDDYVKYKKGTTLYVNATLDELWNGPDKFDDLCIKMNPVLGVDYEEI